MPSMTDLEWLERRLDDTVAVAERAVAILHRHYRKHDADDLSKRLRAALGVECLSDRKGRGKGWYERD